MAAQCPNGRAGRLASRRARPDGAGLATSYTERRDVENGNVEVAVLNIPPFVPPSSQFTGTPDPGKHFEMYYEVAQTPPARRRAWDPKAGAAPGAPEYSEVDWADIHPQDRALVRPAETRSG